MLPQPDVAPAAPPKMPWKWLSRPDRDRRRLPDGLRGKRHDGARVRSVDDRVSVQSEGRDQPVMRSWRVDNNGPLEDLLYDMLAGGLAELGERVFESAPLRVQVGN